MEYKDELMEKYSKPSTINAKIIAINSYLKFTGQGACTVKTIKLQSRQCLENVLSRREYNKMLADVSTQRVERRLMPLDMISQQSLR